MVPPELLLGIRNLLLVQMLLVLLVPRHVLNLHREMLRIWSAIKAPFAVRKQAGKRPIRFWEIDMTDFEP